MPECARKAIRVNSSRSRSSPDLAGELHDGYGCQFRIDLPALRRAAAQASPLAHRQLPILQFDRHTQYSRGPSADFS